MIYHFNKHLSLSVLLVSLAFIQFGYTICMAAEESKKHQTFMNVDFKQSDNQRKLSATLTARIAGERGRKRVAGAEIEFYYVVDTIRILLGKAATNAEGFAEIGIGEDQNISDPAGNYNFFAVFKGDEAYGEVYRSRAFQPARLVLSFAEIDSVKHIVATASQTDETGKEIPVRALVRFYVPGQFSMLELGRERLQEGKAMIRFPETLPGDSTGNLKIIAKIEGSKKYGTVEATGTKGWGVPRPPVVIEKRRGLGDTDAPLWMVYTLIILLSAVWFHYMYIIYVFMSIKRKGKNPEPV